MICHIFAYIAKHERRKIFADFFCIFKGCEIIFYSSRETFVWSVVKNSNEHIRKFSADYLNPPPSLRDTCSVDARNKE
jgi:hypothetical protein